MPSLVHDLLPVHGEWALPVQPGMGRWGGLAWVW